MSQGGLRVPAHQTVSATPRTKSPPVGHGTPWLRVLELEEENRLLKQQNAELVEAYNGLLAKSQLFQAKILELQARLFTTKPSERYRSPLISTPDGKVVYRFERPMSERPMSARSECQTRYQTITPLSARSARLITPRPASSPSGGRKASGENVAHQKPTVLDDVRSSERNGLEKLGAILSSGAFKYGTDVLVKVEYSTIAPHSTPRSQFARQDASKYAQVMHREYLRLKFRPTFLTACCYVVVQAAQDVQQAVSITFEGWRVKCTVQEQSERPSSGTASGVGCILPPGAFEIWVGWCTDTGIEWGLLHSKLHTQRFPDTLSLLSPLLSLLSGYSTALSCSPTSSLVAAQ